jgi:hypothetical protein
MIVEEDAVANSCLKSKDLRRRVIIYSPEEENGHINCLSARWILEVQYIALEEMAGEKWSATKSHIREYGSFKANVSIIVSRRSALWRSLLVRC